MASLPAPRILTAACGYWRDCIAHSGVVRGSQEFLAAIWGFLRDSTPSRLRSRFGDADYDWDFRVNTTSGAVGWRDRLLGVFHSAYQPTERELFHEMMDALAQETNLDFRAFTFIDLGSGKGRTLLMASDYPFRRIMGVELLPSLNEIAAAEPVAVSQRVAKVFRDRIHLRRRNLVRPSPASASHLPVQSISGIRAASLAGESPKVSD